MLIWRISNPTPLPDFSICSMRCLESEAIASKNISTSCIFSVQMCFSATSKMLKSAMGRQAAIATVSLGRGMPHTTDINFA